MQYGSSLKERLQENGYEIISGSNKILEKMIEIFENKSSSLR